MNNESTNISWQKSQPNLKISYNLDYNNKSIWIIPPMNDELREFPFYVQEVGFTSANKNYYVQRENLDSYMLCYIYKGMGCLEYSGHRMETAQGDCFWLNCKRNHTFRTQKDPGFVEAFYVHFNGSGAAKSSQYFDSINDTGCIHASNNNITSFYFKKLIDLYRKDSRTNITDFAASAYLSSLSMELLEAAQQKFKGAIPDFVYEVRSYIENEYAGPINLDMLSTKYFVSKAYLQKQFKKHIGISPNDYLMQIRISNSKKLLRFSSKPICEIALEVGFNDTSYFISSFRKSEDITPLKYRKMWS